MYAKLLMTELALAKLINLLINSFLITQNWSWMLIRPNVFLLCPCLSGHQWDALYEGRLIRIYKSPTSSIKRYPRDKIGSVKLDIQKCLRTKRSRPCLKAPQRNSDQVKWNPSSRIIASMSLLRIPSSVSEENYQEEQRGSGGQGHGTAWTGLANECTVEGSKLM